MKSSEEADRLWEEILEYVRPDLRPGRPVMGSAAASSAVSWRCLKCGYVASYQAQTAGRHWFGTSGGGHWCDGAFGRLVGGVPEPAEKAAARRRDENLRRLFGGDE